MKRSSTMSLFVRRPSRLVLALTVILLFAPEISVQGGSRSWQAAPPNPPAFEYSAPEDTAGLPVPSALAPQAEWMFHKTADNQHPNGREQQMVWLMNRARANPTQEGIWLATTTDPDIAGPRNYFDVNTTLLRNEFASYAAKPPAAFDARLWQAAKAHSDYMISANSQTHDGQFDRIDAAGFKYWAVGGSIFAYADGPVNCHAAWNIDWDDSSDGMQDHRGHRKNLMAIDYNFTNAGIALVADNNPNTSLGPWVATANYAEAQTSQPNHYNRFLVGTVWNDMDGDSFYDPGEGLGGITVSPGGGAFFAVTGASGGYAIPITAAGAFTVSFTGGGINQTRQVTVGSASVLLDLIAAPVLGDERVYLPLAMQ